MATFINDLNNSVGVLTSLLPQTIAATTNGTGVDTQGYADEVMAIVSVGTLADGGYTFSVQDSADNSTFAAISGNTTVEITTANDAALYTIKVSRGHRRYLRVVATETTAGVTGGPVAAEFVLVKRRT